MAKDLNKLQSNIQIARLLKSKEEQKSSRVEFNQLREKGFHMPDLLTSVDLTQKKCHLWLVGPPNSGKTYFVERLSELGINMYQGPYNNDWTGFDQEFHQIIFFDEFRGQLTVQSINDLCNQFTRLNCKFGGYQKTQKTLVMILSNFTIDEAYHNLKDKDSEVLDSLKTRFRVIRFSHRRDNSESRIHSQIERSRSRSPNQVTSVQNVADGLVPQFNVNVHGLFD